MFVVPLHPFRKSLDLHPLFVAVAFGVPDLSIKQITVHCAACVPHCEVRGSTPLVEAEFKDDQREGEMICPNIKV